MGGVRGGGGGQGVRTPPLKIHKNIGLSSNTGPDPLKNHKVTKPAFNVGPSSARQFSIIKMGFHWRADIGPLMAVFGLSFPSLAKKKRCQCWTPSGKTIGICLILSSLTYVFADG